MQPTTTIKYFAFAHLPVHLQIISKPIGDLANHLEAVLPVCAEKSAGMRKLLEAKDCFVRAALEKPAEAQPPQDNRNIAAGSERFPELPPHRQRVVDEHADLCLKTEKLAAFLGTPTYCGLPDAEQARLAKQLEAMNMYCGILIQRIQAFATV